MQASVVAATITQDSSIGNQGGSSNLQRFESHHPPTLKGGGDPMVVIHCFRIVGKDMGASDKRKESQPSSSFRKKQKTSASHESQGLGRGHQGQGQGQSFRGGRHFSAPSQLGKMKCYHYHHPRHKRRDCPQRQGSHNYETPQSQASVGHAPMQFVPPYPNMGQGNQRQS